MLFASPFLSPALLPVPYRPASVSAQAPCDGKQASVHTMQPGKPVRAGDWGCAETLVFPPGVFWLEPRGKATIKLCENTTHVHLAAGAYIKGAIEYSAPSALAPVLRATGHGVLSGEHYVYQANVAANFTAVKSDATSLRMWWHRGGTGGAGDAAQEWHCVGPTLHAPPFNSMDMATRPAVLLADYKQVGAFFYQTDGPEIYENSVVQDVFLHVNDDALKAYYSNVSVSRATIWKGLNDPVVQLGWAARDVHHVRIETLRVVHARYLSAAMYVPSAIFGASPFYSAGTVLPNNTIALDATDIVCEGVGCPALLRLTPLQSYNVQLRDVAFPDGLDAGGSLGIGVSMVPAASPAVSMGLHIANWTVSNRTVTMDNFQACSLGKLNIDVSYWGQWDIS